MAKKIFLFFAILFCFAILNADNFENVKVISVYDGDTFKVNLPCEQDLFCKEISVRVNGIDTPEMKAKNSCEKQKAVEAQILARNILNKGPVILKNCKRDKYFRMLCDVSVLGQNQGYDLSEELLQAGLAVSYHGEAKANVDWCKISKNNAKQSSFLDELLAVLKTLLDEIFDFIKNL